MNKVYVGNLPYQATEQELQSTFEQFGAIESVRLITDRYTGKSKGFAFITFDDKSSADSALKLDGSDFNGRPLKVNIAKERSGGDRGGDRRGGGRASY